MKELFNNKNISLALDSGSAKGVAHIGVIEELLKQKYKIQAVAGTSMGAIVGAYFALGKLDILKEWLINLNKKSTFFTIDFSLGGGFIGGKKLMQAFEEHLGHARFEDCEIPLYIVATNLDKGCEEIFSSGEIIPALRASISVPGVVRPYFYNGYYYVDGAVTNPLPVDVLYNKGYKNIVAVHLHEFIDERDNSSAPGVVESMSRSMSIVSRYLAKAKSKDAIAIIEPKVADFDMFSFYQSKDIIESGRTAALEAIEKGHLDSFSVKLLYKIKNKVNNKLLKKLYN